MDGGLAATADEADRPLPVAMTLLPLGDFAAPACEAADRAFGLFRIGAALVAIPVEAVREATPARPLSALPGNCPGLLGALTLRGDVIPVLDLRPALGMGRDGAPQPVILVVRLSDRRLLGLSTDEVCGMARAPAGATARLDTRSEGEATLTPETLVVGDEAAVVLDIERIAWLPGVPLGLEKTAAAARAAVARNARAMLLFRVGTAHFAVDALRVEAAAPRAPIRRNALSHGPCIGVIERQRLEIPVLCPLGALGIGATRSPAEAPVVIIRLDDGGLVGFAMDEVRDIRRLPLAEILPLPGGHAGAGPFSGLIGEPGGVQNLVLDLAALSSERLFTDLAALTRRLRQDDEESDAAAATQDAGLFADEDADAVPGAAGAAGDAPAILPDRRQHLIYHAGAEFATALVDVREIVPMPPTPAPAPSRAPGLLGLWRHRDAATPLYSLAVALGLPQPEREAHVLIVTAERGRVGFAVERLRSIEAAVWRSRQTMADHAPGDVLVRIGAGAGGRAVAQADLVRLAGALLGG